MHLYFILVKLFMLEYFKFMSADIEKKHRKNFSESDYLNDKYHFLWLQLKYFECLE